MHNRLSSRISNIGLSPTMEITAQAKTLIEQGEDIIALSAGESSFDTLPEICSAGMDAINDGKTRYTQVDGIPDLKQAIVDRYERDYGLSFDLSEILVSTGAKHALFNALSAIINRHDEVLIHAPYWVSYPDMVKLCQGRPVIIHGKKQGQFKLTATALKKAITRKTKALILNSPNNPTGVVYSKEDLTELAAVLVEHPDVFIICDEIYDLIYWSNPLVHLLNVAPDLKHRVIIVNGISKGYAMAGWRIGYSIAPDDVTKAMRTFQSQTLSNPCSISQYAAVQALSMPRDGLKAHINAYEERVSYVSDRLNALDGFSVDKPQGAFYLFVNIQPFLSKVGFDSDQAFVLYLLNKQKVAVIHGSAFGEPGYIRVSCASDMSVLAKAMDRIATFVKQCYLSE